MKKYFAIVLMGSLFACSNPDKKSAGNTDTVSKFDTPAEVADVVLSDTSADRIYDSYIDLKNNLVASNFEAAQAAAKTLSADLQRKQGCENTAVTVDKITAAKDIVSQRKEFTSVSNDLIAMFQHSELKAGTIYVQRCPMANGGDGGEWLSSKKEIRNPYYGDEMMECGSVIQEIKN